MTRMSIRGDPAAPARVFLIAAAVMTLYESLKELIFRGGLSAWESHTMTILVTASIATGISHFVRQRARRLDAAALLLETRANRFNETLINTLPVAVFYKDREGRYLGCNQLFSEIMGVSEEDIRGKTVFELWPSDLSQVYHQKDLELMSNPVFQQYEFQVRDKDGRSRDVIYGKAVFRDEHGEVAGIIGSFFDIFEKKEIERALAAYRERLEVMVAEKTEELHRSNAALVVARDTAEAANRAKSAFLMTMSHELRTPLNAVLGFAQILEGDVSDPAQRDSAHLIVDNGYTLLQLIDDILLMSEASYLDRENDKSTFMLDNVLVDVAARWNKQAQRKGLKLVVEQKEQISGPLHGNPGLLAKILGNLLDNAFKFSSAGVIVLRTIEVGSSGEGLCLRFEVSDQGMGIESRHHQLIFEPFMQVDDSSTRKHGGSGLGLAVCKQLVVAMGGEIGVESTPGRGSTFWFKLPLAAALPGSESAQM